MNKLFYGDNLDILRKFVRDETVDLCYIEPLSPFYNKLQIVTVQEILDGARMNLPLMEEVTKRANKAKKDNQPSFLE